MNGLVALVLGLSLSAPKPALLSAELARQGEHLVASFRVTSAFDDDFRRKVDGGLESRVEIFTELTDASGDVVGSGRRSCKILYSVWDERVFVLIRDEGRASPRQLVFEQVEPALDACGRADRLPVGFSAATSETRGFRLHTLISLNPVSEELVERSRQFVSNPSGVTKGGPNAVLGAVAGLFSREGSVLGSAVEMKSPPLTIYETATLPRPLVPELRPTQLRPIRAPLSRVPTSSAGSARADASVGSATISPPFSGRKHP